MTEQAPENTAKTFGHPPVPVEDVVDAEGNTYCQVHTDRETGLRCNNCDRLMCAKCAVHTPVGYRCEQCVHQLENKFFNADQSYYIKLAAVTVIGGAIGAFIANFVGFFLFIFLIGAAAGGAISEVATRYIKGQRGRYAGEVAAAGIVGGTLITMALIAFNLTSRYTGFAMQELIAEYGQEAAQEILDANRQGQISLFFSFFQRQLFNFSILIYTAITAITVYGRFNIYGGRKRR